MSNIKKEEKINKRGKAQSGMLSAPEIHTTSQSDADNSAPAEQPSTDAAGANGLYSGLQQKLEGAAAALENWDDFSYDINGDALYRQYRDIFEKQGRLAMLDSSAQANAMSGGYSNSYAQSVGQQTYQQNLSRLNDKIPELYELAYRRHRDEWQNRLDRYNLYSGQEEQQHKRRQESYDRLYNIISASGYIPTAQQLAEAGMSRGEADALRLGWAKADPDSAYRGSYINRDEYYQLTGI